jgi:hypothetical protein
MVAASGIGVPSVARPTIASTSRGIVAASPTGAAGSVCAVDDAVDEHSVDTDAAWAAGLFEGEDSIVFNQNRLVLQLRMCDEEPVRRLPRILGGRVPGPYDNSSRDGSVRQPFVMWVARGSEARYAFAAMRPWLSRKRLDKYVRIAHFPVKCASTLPRP